MWLRAKGRVIVVAAPGLVRRAATTVYELSDRVAEFAEKIYGRELALWQRRVLREVLTADPDDPRSLKPSPIESERRP